MDKKSRIVNVISAIAAVGFLIVMVIMKGRYYQLRSASGWFKMNNDTDRFITAAWLIASFLMSALPMIFVLIGNISKSGSQIYTFSRLIALGMCGFNLAFELISLGGGGATLNDEWVDIAIKMLIYHGVSLLLIGLNLALVFVEERKRRIR